MMFKRGFLFGEYDTAYALWTLTSWSLSAPVYRSMIVSVPGRDGDLDLSTALTDGIPKYANRTLKATFECSEGCRHERDQHIDQTINLLDGMRMHIVLPDDPTHYLVGRLHVEKLYSDLAHASIRISANCEPWRYATEETTITADAKAETQTLTLTNRGRALLIPTVKVIGGSVRIAVGEMSWTLSDGEYILPDLTLSKGDTIVTYSGDGRVEFSYREAIL